MKTVFDDRRFSFQIENIVSAEIKGIVFGDQFVFFYVDRINNILDDRSVFLSLSLISFLVAIDEVSLVLK